MNKDKLYKIGMLYGCEIFAKNTQNHPDINEVVKQLLIPEMDKLCHMNTYRKIRYMFSSAWLAFRIARIKAKHFK